MILARLEEYERKTIPVVEIYRKANRVIDIDGARPANEVFEDLHRAVTRAYKRIH